MAEEKRLIGNDGSLATIAWGSTVTTAVPSRTWAKIIAKAADTGIIGAGSVAVTVASVSGSGGATPTMVVSLAPTNLSVGDIVRFTYLGVTYSGAVASGHTTTSVVLAAGTLLPTGMTGQTLALVKGSRFGALDVGGFFYNPSASTLAIASGDSYQVATITTMLDINGWNLKLTAAEVDVTTLADGTRKYRKGKADAEGAISFVWIKGISDQAGGLVNQFLSIADISAAGAVTYTAKDTDALYLIGYLDATTVAGEIMEATLLQIELFDVAINVKDNEANNQDVKFRLNGASNPVIYRITNAA